MENHIISKDKKEHRFLKLKENKICIFNPMGECSFHGVLLFMTIESMLCKDSIVDSVFLLVGLFYQVSQITL